MTDEPGFGKETHSTYEPLPEEIAARRVTDPAAHTDYSLCCECGQGWPVGMSGSSSCLQHPSGQRHFPNCPCDAAHTPSDSAGVPDVDALADKAAEAYLGGGQLLRRVHQPDERGPQRRARVYVAPIHESVVRDSRAALSDLAAIAREREEQRNRVGKIAADETIQAHKNLMRAEAAEDDRDRLREELDHLKSEFNYESLRGDHLVYEREWQAFDAWQRGEGDRLARRVAELEAALRWYAEQRNYRYAGGDDRNSEHNENYCRVMQDDAWLGGQPGSRARAALRDGGGA